MLRRFGFNPRTPCGVRQAGDGIKPFNYDVSIHALLAECDMPPLSWIYVLTRFNPRTPCGVRPNLGDMTKYHEWFQSTHSLRSATRYAFEYDHEDHVSIHALLAECDSTEFTTLLKTYGFNPRTPCGVRPGSCCILRRIRRFNPRTPCGVRPTAPAQPASPIPFQSTHSLRSATLAFLSLRNPVLRFQSTHSLRSATARRHYRCPQVVVSIHALLAECDHRNG